MSPRSGFANLFILRKRNSSKPMTFEANTCKFIPQFNIKCRVRNCVDLIT
ncbi:hypothetical protein AN958_09911 [Leucoagaricus sp. SymC.cos]|nr:hypothetical protein AN958_09911 [Leucoagaricus sp. SymC.cos]